jgi:hypothetical protein
MSEQAPTSNTRTEEMTVSSIAQELWSHRAQLAGRRDSGKKFPRPGSVAAKFRSSRTDLQKNPPVAYVAKVDASHDRVREPRRQSKEHGSRAENGSKAILKFRFPLSHS